MCEIIPTLCSLSFSGLTLNLDRSWPLFLPLFVSLSLSSTSKILIMHMLECLRMS